MINLRIYTYYTPITLPTFEIKQPITDVEETIAKLLQKGTIDESYAVVFFTQEAIFENKKSELQKQYTDKIIVVCGSQIFIGDNFDEAERKAQAKYPDQPFFSHSFKKEYSTF